jgi:hypothetical protein
MNIQQILDSIDTKKVDAQVLHSVLAAPGSLPKSADHKAKIGASNKGVPRIDEIAKARLAEARRAAGPSVKQKIAVSSAATARHEAHRASQEHLFKAVIANPVIVKGRPSLISTAQKYGVTAKAVRSYAKRIGIL